MNSGWLISLALQHGSKFWASFKAARKNPWTFKKREIINIPGTVGYENECRWSSWDLRTKKTSKGRCMRAKLLNLSLHLCKKISLLRLYNLTNYFLMCSKLAYLAFVEVFNHLPFRLTFTTLQQTLTWWMVLSWNWICLYFVIRFAILRRKGGTETAQRKEQIVCTSKQLFM